MPLFRSISRFAAIFVVLAFTAGAAAQSLGPDHVRAVLVAETRGAAPGSTLYVALVQTIDKGWHTYWRNPGDAGEPTHIHWTLPAGWKAGDIVWPAPKRLPVGPLMNYGFENEAVLAVPIEVPADAKPGATGRLTAKAEMLVCADVCVPQTAELALDVPVTAGAPPSDPVWGSKIARALAASPKERGVTATYQVKGDTLSVAIADPALAKASGGDAYFYPSASGLIDQAKPESIDLGDQGATFQATRSADLKSAPAQISGVVETEDGQAFEVTASAGPPPPHTGGLGAPAAVDRLGLPVAVAFAFLGGLILNLMPCVFPILSMKAAALIARPRPARAQGLAFLAGVLATFLALAGGIIALRGAGQAVGWGAHLQPAIVTGSLALVLLASALDLSGVFEIGASLQGLGGGIAARADLLGDLFTGALAVVVAAPCTAPFMGPALGFALSQSPPIA